MICLASWLFRCAVATLLASAASAQTPSYRLQFVGGSPTNWTGGIGALAVNDAGQVIGNTTVAAVRRPWVGAPGSALELLPLPTGTRYAEARDLNSHGVIAGFVLLPAGSRAAIWRVGANGYEISLLPGDSSGVFPFDARGINDRGEVVGKLGVLSGSYVWSESGGVRRLAGYRSTPEDINERGQVIGDIWRMDVHTGTIENLGAPTGTGFNYLFTDLWRINDAGECGGYGNVASSQSRNKQALRYSDGPSWRAFHSQPARSANVMGLAASGDTAFHTGAGAYGSFVHVEGHGTLSLPSLLAPAFANWDLSGSFAPVISRGGRIACNGIDRSTGRAGVVVLTLDGFLDLGGSTAGTLGTPVLDGYGALLANAPTRLRVASAAPNRPAFLVVAPNASPMPFVGGTLHPDLVSGVAVALQTDASGRLALTFAWPPTTAGTSFYLQAGALDPQAPSGVSLSNGLVGVTR